MVKGFRPSCRREDAGTGNWGDSNAKEGAVRPCLADGNAWEVLAGLLWDWGEVEKRREDGEAGELLAAKKFGFPQRWPCQEADCLFVVSRPLDWSSWLI